MKLFLASSGICSRRYRKAIMCFVQRIGFVSPNLFASRPYNSWDLCQLHGLRSVRKHMCNEPSFSSSERANAVRIECRSHLRNGLKLSAGRTTSLSNFKIASPIHACRGCSDRSGTACNAQSLHSNRLHSGDVGSIVHCTCRAGTHCQHWCYQPIRDKALYNV